MWGLFFVEIVGDWVEWEVKVIVVIFVLLIG